MVVPFQPILSEEDIFQRYKIVRFCIKLHLSENVHDEEGSVHTLSKAGVFILSVHGSVQAICGTFGNTSSDLALVYHLSVHHMHCSKLGMERCFVLARQQVSQGGRRQSFEVF